MGGPGSGGDHGGFGGQHARQTQRDDNHPLKKRMVKAREKDVQALELRKAGGSYRHIGKVMGISPQSALNCCRRALDELMHKIHESAEQLREIEAGRLDSLQLGLWQKATGGDPQAVEAVRKICESRRRLYGLDAPEEFAGAVAVSADAEVHLYWPENGRGPKKA